MDPLRLPRKHATDWLDRCGDAGTQLVSETERTVTLALDDDALRDLISDAEHYVECMGPQDTGGADYRPAARTCLASLRKSGVTWTVTPSGFVRDVRRTT